MDSQAARFSIVIPTYNRGYVVWQAIQSVQAQTLQDWELIVVDDGSTDDTAKVIAQFQDDPRIKYLKQSNAGANAARNHGLDAATGEIVGYLDSDDVLYPDCLATVSSAFEQHAGAVFCVSNYDFVLELCDATGRVIATRTDERMNQGTVTMTSIAHWQSPTAYGTALFHRRQPVLNAGVRWDPSLHHFDDWDFILQLTRVFPDGFHHIPAKLYRYAQRYGTDGTCSSVTEYAQWADAFEAIWRKHQHHPLMAGQPWYPAKVQKYRRLQKELDAGRTVPPAYKYFPEYYHPSD